MLLCTRQQMTSQRSVMMLSRNCHMLSNMKGQSHSYLACSHPEGSDILKIVKFLAHCLQVSYSKSFNRRFRERSGMRTQQSKGLAGTELSTFQASEASSPIPGNWAAATAKPHPNLLVLRKSCAWSCGNSVCDGGRRVTAWQTAIGVHKARRAQSALLSVFWNRHNCTSE